MTTEYIKPAYETIAHAVLARNNCIAQNNQEWRMTHFETADRIVADHFPRGSGFDAGTTLNWDKTTPEKLVFNTSYHHMNDAGYYDGWTEHQVIVTPSLVFGYNLKVTGRNRNDIKNYIEEMFCEALDLPMNRDGRFQRAAA